MSNEVQSNSVEDVPLRHDTDGGSAAEDDKVEDAEATEVTVKSPLSAGDQHREGHRGCVILGDDDDEERSGAHDLDMRQKRGQYVTRYRIDHKLQTQNLCSSVTSHQLFPCCEACDGNERQRSTTSWFWYLVSSQLLVFGLHICSITLGVVKEALDLRKLGMQDLHLIHSVLEQIAVSLILVVLTLHAHLGYVKVRQALVTLERFYDDHDAQLSSIRMWMWLVSAVSVTHLVACVVCFIVFYLYAHLGWTVLSNQLCIASMGLLISLYTSRVVAAVAKIKEDQQKVLIYEGVMLLREQGKAECFRGHQYADAIDNTKAIALPKYIYIDSASQQSSSC